MAIAIAENLGKRFGPRWVFRRLEWELGEGDVLLLTGPNGSGKSTLLKVAAGLIAPSEGQVARPKNMGYSALDQSLYAPLTAREHLQFAADLRGLFNPRFDLLVESGLPADSPVGTFSTGMRARLRLALAVQADPILLLLDEPSTALDDAGQDLVAKVIAAQRQRGATLLATNDPRDRAFATHELRLDA